MKQTVSFKVIVHNNKSAGYSMISSTWVAVNFIAPYSNRRYEPLKIGGSKQAAICRTFARFAYRKRERPG